MPFRAASGPDLNKRDRGTVRRNEIPPVVRRGSGCGSDLAVVPEIDHCVGEGLERVMHPADAFEAQQEPAEFVLPGEHALDRPEALFEDGRLEDWLAAPLGLLSTARIGVKIGRASCRERVWR